MKKNFKGELVIMDSLGIKPNYAALARKYNLDWRTVKKYHQGYEGKVATRNKPSKLDLYRGEIIDKLKIHRITVQGVYQFMVNKYGISRIGTYSNFNKYVKKHKLITKNQSNGHPRFETEPGVQAQVDWKEDIQIPNKYGEIFEVNVLNVSLKFSRFNYLELSMHKRFEDVERGLINAFRHFGGVPEELLFDNMTTVANIRTKPKKPTNAIMQLAKDFGFKVRLCKFRSAQTKGSVEAKNKVIDWLRAYAGEFENIDELMEIVEAINTKANTLINQETDMSPSALFYKEKEYLQPLPPKDIIDTHLTNKTHMVSKESLIRYGNNKYSVDPALIGKEVSVELLGNRIYIYYSGKLSTIHTLNTNPINYQENHYRKLMEGKVKEENMDVVVCKNLEMMDKLLESRKVAVTGIEATKSTESLIAYINQSDMGRWVINYFAHLSTADRLVFIKGMNEVLPYVGNQDKFISHIKYSMKDNMCKTIAFDCWVNDLMAVSEGDCILSDEGFEVIKNKYANEIEELFKDMNERVKEEA